jgi:hypothetical protein
VVILTIDTTSSVVALESDLCSDCQTLDEFKTGDSTTFKKTSDAPVVVKYDSGAEISAYESTDIICATPDQADDNCIKDFKIATIKSNGGDDTYDNILDTGRIGLGLKTKAEEPFDSMIDMLVANNFIAHKTFSLYFKNIHHKDAAAHESELMFGGHNHNLASGE